MSNIVNLEIVEDDANSTPAAIDSIALANSLYDYIQTEEIAAEIHARNALFSGLRLGYLLSELKTATPHGGWEILFAGAEKLGRTTKLLPSKSSNGTHVCHFEFTRTTAHRYMSCYKAAMERAVNHNNHQSTIMATPVITPAVTTRVVSHDVLAAISMTFCRAGTVVDGKTVSPAYMPDFTLVPEAWAGFGGISDMAFTPDEKKLELLKANDNGGWIKHKDVMLEALDLNWTSLSMTPEAWELMLGAKGPLDDGKEFELAAKGANTIEGYLRFAIKRSQDGQDKITALVAYGRLHIKTMPKMTDDYAKPEFEYYVDLGNPYNTFTPANIQALKAIAG